MLKEQVEMDRSARTVKIEHAKAAETLDGAGCVEGLLGSDSPGADVCEGGGAVIRVEDGGADV